MKTIKREFPSTDGVHSLAATLSLPEGEVCGIVQVIHGMTDYTDRCEDLFFALSKAGYLVVGYDHLGHGRTAKDKEELGFFAEKDGWKILVSDAVSVASAIRKEYGKELPYILLGHSMGSFVARLAAMKIAPEKLVLVGTSGGESGASLGRAMSFLLAKLYGTRHVSHLMQGLVFGDYDKRFPGNYPSRWITVDTDNLIRYKDDPFCTFRFSVSAIGDLIALHQKANSSTFYSQLPEGTSVLLLSGEDDPVGGYGEGVEKVYWKLLRKGKKAKMILYPGYRHEILQDFCKKQVVEDILSFLEQ
jgi:alpha-beta hydrolase superfamily lysophospholipase